jgi:DHA3 family multidrug efflux protein-like MFS transporter
MPRAFYHLLSNNLIANVTNFFVWATAIYWAYLSTNSVLAPSLMAGIHLVVTAACGLWFGTLVDHARKKTAMLLSSLATFSFFALALGLYALNDPGSFSHIGSVPLWSVVVLMLLGAIAGNIRMIALPTAIAILVPEDRRDKANGMSGMVFGASFAVSNVAAGVGLGFLGFFWTMGIALALTALAALHLLLVTVDESAGAAKTTATATGSSPPVEEGTPRNTPTPATSGKKSKMDLKGTFAVVRAVPGLLPLIFFTTFNNFLGGIFMALMDAYGLSLVSVQFWGTLWGVLSLGFILGGLYISKYGLGRNPVGTIFKVNVACWIACMVMTLQPSIWLLAGAIFIWLCIMPFVEACEQTVLQKVVPTDRLGRVIGFAQSVEMSAAPLTAFLIGPLAQYFFIPFMTTGKGVEWIGGWYGVGHGRGIGLVFVCAGVIGLVVTLLAWRSRAFKLLSERYQAASKDAETADPASSATGGATG